MVIHSFKELLYTCLRNHPRDMNLSDMHFGNVNFRNLFNTTEEKIDENLRDDSIYDIINGHIDELVKKITIQEARLVHWDGGMDPPDSNDYVDIFRYGDIVVAGGRYLDGSALEGCDFLESDDKRKNLNKVAIIKLLSDCEDALELFCKDYNVDFLRASYTLDNIGPKSIEAYKNYVNEKLDSLLNDNPKLS